MAVTWGTPTPATTRVVQMEPGPTPTLTPSAPAAMSAWAPARLAMLPPTISTCRLALSWPTMSSTACEWPCAVSTTRKSAPASASAWARPLASSPTPTAAPTTSRPALSLVACGNFSLLVKSLTVISPRSRPVPSISGSFSTLCWRSSASASALATPTGAVISGIGVITSVTRRLWSVTNRMSRLVTMPTSTPSGLVTGTPEIRYRAHSSSTSATVASGPQVTGLVIMPASDRLTVSTCCACSSAERLRCSTPTPPMRAMAMAIRASVTVSMAEETSGTFSVIWRVSRAVVSASLGITSECAGSSSTSSKVRAGGANLATSLMAPSGGRAAGSPQFRGTV